MKKDSSMLVILVASVALNTLDFTQAYDVGCIYPPTMPDPQLTQSEMVLMLSVTQQDEDGIATETPVAVHRALVVALCAANCLAYHDSKVLNAITMKRPLMVAPEFGHNAYSIAMCNAQCVTSGMGLERMQPILDKWGLPITEQFYGPFLEIVDGKEEEFTAMDYFNIFQIVKENDYHPFLMGQIVMVEIYGYLLDDGWNGFGDYSYDIGTQTVVNCTANCMKYSDISGYQPRNPYPRAFKEEDKYKVTGDDMYWQPLLEDNGEGYFSRQEHVTPHLGKTAVPILDENIHNRSLSPPDYDYYNEALQVIEELRKTAESVERKNKIKFFDNKFIVRGLVQSEVGAQFKDQHSYQRRLLFVVGIAMSEDEGILAAWMEKVRHDLVRPTTVIQKWGSDQILTYNGDTNSTEASIIDARNFEAFIRVMPHSEYPSGSSCLCTTYHNYTKAYTEYFYGGNVGNLRYDDGEVVIELENLDDLVHQCGQSRLWGGMHFSKSVPAGVEICSGLGNMAFEKVKKILGDSNFGGKEHFLGDPRPVCQNKTVTNDKNSSNDKIISDSASMCSDCTKNVGEPKTNGDHQSSDSNRHALKLFSPICGAISLLFFLWI